jgi:hemoglobin-like flavoprotein
VSERFFLAFNDNLLNGSPLVAQVFTGTSVTRRQELLKDSLVLMYAKYGEGSSAPQKLQRVGEIHSRTMVNVKPTLYPLWMQALIDALKAFDDKFDANLEADWTIAVRPAIDLLIARH